MWRRAGAGGCRHAPRADTAELIPGQGSRACADADVMAVYERSDRALTPKTSSADGNRCTGPTRRTPRSRVPALCDICHSNATQSKEVLGSIFEKRSQPGAPLRNRTVDLLLTMYRSAVLEPQVGQLTCRYTSTGGHTQAPGGPSQAPFATRFATQIDLGTPRCLRSLAARLSLGGCTWRTSSGTSSVSSRP